MFNICFHKWTKWSDPILAYSGHKQQWRCCVKCNKAIFRTLSWGGQSNIKEVLEKLKDERESND